LPRGLLHAFNTILYENEFQKPQIFQQTISLFPEQSTLAAKKHTTVKSNLIFRILTPSAWIFENDKIVGGEFRVITGFKKLFF
jgi:hypothetical protein